MRTVFVMCGFRRVRTQYESLLPLWPKKRCRPDGGVCFNLSIYQYICPLAYLLRV